MAEMTFMSPWRPSGQVQQWKMEPYSSYFVNVASQVMMVPVSILFSLRPAMAVQGLNEEPGA